MRSSKYQREAKHDSRVLLNKHSLFSGIFYLWCPESKCTLFVLSIVNPSLAHQALQIFACWLCGLFPLRDGLLVIKYHGVLDLPSKLTENFGHSFLAHRRSWQQLSWVFWRRSGSAVEDPERLLSIERSRVLRAPCSRRSTRHDRTRRGGWWILLDALIDSCQCRSLYASSNQGIIHQGSEYRSSWVRTWAAHTRQ